MRMLGGCQGLLFMHAAFALQADMLAKSPHTRTDDIYDQLCLDLDKEMRQPSFAEATSRFVIGLPSRICSELDICTSIRPALSKLNVHAEQRLVQSL